MRIVFLEVEPVDEQSVYEMFSGHDVTVYHEIFDIPKLREVCADAEVISPFIYSKIDRSVIDAAPDLKLITTRSTGFDHVDTKYAAEKGIPVCNVPQYGMNTVAEHAFALILDIIRKLSPSWDTVKAGKFSYEGFRGRDMKGKTIGVIGTGRIGLHAVRIANGFEMDVIAYDVYHNEPARAELGFEYVELDELMERSDIITIHLPLLESTFHLINRERIDQAKKGVIIVNTARGPIVDTDAIVYGFEKGILGGAGLDVVEDELSLTTDHPLLGFENVVISPHTAFYTDEAMLRILGTTLDNVNGFIDGTPVNLVE